MLNLLKLHFIIFLWGFTAILGVLIHIHPVDLVFYRTAISAIVLGAMLLTIEKGTFRIPPRREIYKLLAAGGLLALHWILFFASAKISKVSVCLAGIATGSLFTALLEPLYHRQRIKFVEVFLGLLVIGGLYLIFSFEFDHFWGLVLALLAAVLSAMFSVVTNVFAKKHDASVVTFFQMAGGWVASIFFLLLYPLLFPADTKPFLALPTAAEWPYILALTLVCTVFAYKMCVQVMSAKNMSAFFVNLSVNMEPVYGIALAVIIFGERERMTPQFYMGTLIILSSVLFYPFLKRLAARVGRKAEVVQ